MRATRQQIEDAVISRLKPLEGSHKYKVFAWPDGNYLGAKADRSLLVAISGEKWGPPLTMDGDQQGTLSVQLQLVNRHRRGNHGQLAVRDAIDALMHGEIDGVGPCYLTKSDFLGRDQAIWQYGMTYEIQTFRSLIGA